MLARLTIVFSLLAHTASATSCTSLASLVKGNSGAPPSGKGVPDCAYITQHASTICYGLGAWDIVNSDTCYLKASGYGCFMTNGLFSTTDTFYCNLGVAIQPSESPTASASASVSATQTALSSLSPSASPSASPSTSASQSASPFSTMNPSSTSLTTASSTQTSTQSPSSSAYPTLTSTLSGSVSPSMNVTIVYIKAPMGDGEKAAIGLSAIFGFCILFFCCGACAFMLRRKAPEPPLSIKLPQSRRTSTVEKAPSRRTSTVEKAPSRRGSMIVISEPQEPRTPKVSSRRNSIVERTVSNSAVTIRTIV